MDRSPWRVFPIPGREPGRVQDEAASGGEVLGHHGKGAIAVSVLGEMDEGIVHGRDQIEPLPHAELAHVCGEEVDMGEAAQLAAGLGDQLGAYVQGDDAPGLSPEERGGAAGARSQFQDAASRRIAGHPDPEILVPPAAQLGFEEGQDAMVVVPNVGRHRSRLLQRACPKEKGFPCPSISHRTCTRLGGEIVKVPERIAAAARSRMKAATEQRERVMEAIRSGRPLDAEPDAARKVNRFQAVTGVSRETARHLASGASPASLGLVGARRAGAERIQGETVDFVGVSFIDRARLAANAVGRIVFPDLRPQGSGFLISDRLLLTNNHVIPSHREARDFLVEFDYELDSDDQPRSLTRFVLEPDELFLTNDEDDLDFTIVAIGRRESGESELSGFGCCPLIATDDKHVLGEFINIVQHPEGDYKQVVLRENRVVTRLATVLHYMADTSPGSSGSPVFNDQWEVVALHHWGEPFREIQTPDGRRIKKDVNEGIRISAIVKALPGLTESLGRAQRELVETALRSARRQPSRASDEVHEVHRPASGEYELPPAARDRHGETGKVVIESRSGSTWQIPLEITIGLRGATPMKTELAQPFVASGSSAEAVTIDRNYSNRRGYRPDFLKGYRIDLPGLGPAQKANAARKLKVTGSEDPYELKYQHFSVVMNVRRRMAFFTACNIDGTTWIDIDRDTGEPREAAEAREKWFDDPRIAPEEQCEQSLYDDQRPRRVFDRGHLVRRQDPAWGTASRAIRANADTFHFTNCTPQESVFNQTAEYWQGIERWILEDSAVADRERVSVFTGPVFSEDDPPYRYVHVPMAFWKIVAYVRDGELRATALLASQKERIKRLPEAVAEDLGDVTAVEEWQTSVREIERLTGLDFGILREHDTLQGGGGEARKTRRRLKSFDDIRL